MSRRMHATHFSPAKIVVLVSTVSKVLRGYECSCPVGVDGTNCQFFRRPCQADTCWNNGSQSRFIFVRSNQSGILSVGTCHELSTSAFVCFCTPGWENTHCDLMINYCAHVTCLNRGVCRPLLLNYMCECLGESYSGRHCEITSRKTAIFKTVSKSCAAVAIVALGIVGMFVLSMDVLKYGFRIDPVRAELEQVSIKVKPKKPVVAIRYVYVNGPSPLSKQVESSSV